MTVGTSGWAASAVEAGATGGVGRDAGAGAGEVVAVAFKSFALGGWRSTRQTSCMRFLKHSPMTRVNPGAM